MPADTAQGVISGGVGGNSVAGKEETDDRMGQDDNLARKNSAGGSHVKWELKRKVADMFTEYEMIAREAHNLSQKRILSPPLDLIPITEEDKRLLHNNHMKRLHDLVQKHCGILIKNLMCHKWAYPFNQPVDTTIYKDYLNYVEKPMDLGTVRSEMPRYKTPQEFERDVRLVFSNARKYNPEGTDVRKMAEALNEAFEMKWNKIILPKLVEEQRACVEEEKALKQSKAGLLVMQAEGDIDHSCGLLLQRLEKFLERIHYTQCVAAGLCGVVSGKERVRLGWEMTTLAAEHFQRAANLVLTRHPGLMATMKDNTIQLDLERMDGLTLRQLQDFVAQCRRGQKKSRASGKDSMGHAKKKQKTANNSTGSNTPDALHASRSTVQWPPIPYGIGLKPYKPDSEPCIPRPPSQPPRQVPYRSHSDALLGPSQPQPRPPLSKLSSMPPSHVRGSTLGSTLGARRPSAGPPKRSQPPPFPAPPRRPSLPTPDSVAFVDRVLLRTQGSVGSSSTPMANMVDNRLLSLGSGTLGSSTLGGGVGEMLGLSRSLGLGLGLGLGGGMSMPPSATPSVPLAAYMDRGPVGMPSVTRASMDMEGVCLAPPTASGPLRPPPIPPVTSTTALPSISFLQLSQPMGLPTSLLSSGILPFSSQISTSAIGQMPLQGSIVPSSTALSAPLVLPFLATNMGNLRRVGPTGITESPRVVSGPPTIAPTSQAVGQTTQGNGNANGNGNAEEGGQTSPAVSQSS